MARAKVVKKQGKKDWFVVEAPDIFKNKDLGEIQAFDPVTLKGRVVKLSYSSITENFKDSDKKFVLRIMDFKGGKAKTQAERIYFLEGYVQRATRGYRTKILCVNKTKAKEKEVLSKLYVLARKRLTRPVKSRLIGRISSALEERVGTVDAYRLFEPNFVEMLARELKKDLKNIYPVDRIVFWKIEVK